MTSTTGLRDMTSLAVSLYVCLPMDEVTVGKSVFNGVLSDHRNLVTDGWMDDGGRCSLEMLMAS